MRRFDLVLLLTLAWFFLAGSALAQKQQKQQQQEGAGESEQDDEEKFNDYEVYGAMDTMKGLKPEAETFYDLLGVDGKSTNEQINRAFRKLSIKYHPDKHGPGTAKMYKLLQFVSTLLQDQKRRARYEWLLHEAPAWHRESVIMARRIRKVTKISLEQSIWITFLLSLAGQFLAQWVAFAIAYGRIMQSRRTLRSMGDKEVKRIRKKLESGIAFVHGDDFCDLFFRGRCFYRLQQF